jgi:SsrA-binding protein
MADYARNKKAHFNYEILETIEAGIVLSGFEVKGVRAGKVSLAGSYVIIRGGELFLTGANITPLQPKNVPKNYEPERPRKLLLSRKEIIHLEKKLNTAGLTIVPLSLYNKNRQVKLAIALVRGKKKADKREALKERDTKRDLQRISKGA